MLLWSMHISKRGIWSFFANLVTYMHVVGVGNYFRQLTQPLRWHLTTLNISWPIVDMVLKGFNNTSIFTPSAVAPWLCLCMSLALDCSGGRRRVSSHHHCGIHFSSHSSLHPSESAYFWRSSLFWCTNRLVLQHLWHISMKLRSGKYKGHCVPVYSRLLLLLTHSLNTCGSPG